MTAPQDAPHGPTSGLSAAVARQAQLTKPPGSLGALESIALDLAAVQDVECPVARPAAVLLFAADHPVVRHGVAAFGAGRGAVLTLDSTPRVLIHGEMATFADAGLEGGRA